MIRFEILPSPEGKCHVNQCSGNKVLNSSEVFNTMQAAKKNILTVAKHFPKEAKIVVKDFTNPVRGYPGTWSPVINGAFLHEVKWLKKNENPTGK